MPRYVAFLRAINVGGHTVKMDHLRKLFEEMGFAKVETFIASGNVIFESPAEDATALEAKIEGHLQQALGYAVATFLRTSRELAEAAACQPFAETEPVALSVCFLKHPPSPEAVQRLMALGTPRDEFAVAGREVYWLCRVKISESKILGGAIEKALGLPSTMRNVTTVRKLAAKYPPAG
ncbi:MAG TPA: DUF1697 domain-containing protein [Longimicrobiaceae bacterium]|jgi:uncharacterized protein (DUF1697 family)|nr:DUF1697 domain-containing protein [Longimicrobiaceae bacterium]